MITLNEERTKRTPDGNITVVFESPDMAELLDSGINSLAVKKAAEMGMTPAGVLNMPRPMAVDAATDEPITGACPKIKCFRTEVVCGTAIP